MSSALEIRDELGRIPHSFMSYDGHNIKLYRLLLMFNELYKSFKREYDELNMSVFGESLAVHHRENGSPVIKQECPNGYKRKVLLYVCKPTFIDRDSTVLVIEDDNEKISGRTCNSLLTGTRFRNGDTVLGINQEQGKKIIDLFEKYQLLFDLYDCLNNNDVEIVGYHFCIHIRTCGIDLLSGLDGIEIEFYKSRIFSRANYCIDLAVDLGDKSVDVDYDQSGLLINGNQCKISNRTLDDLLSETYIGNEYIGGDTQPKLDRVSCLHKVYDEVVNNGKDRK